MTEQMSFDEEKAVSDGGKELQELTPEEVEEKERERTGDETSATPTELKQGAPGATIPGGAGTEGASAANPPS